MQCESISTGAPSKGVHHAGPFTNSEPFLPFVSKPTAANPFKETGETGPDEGGNNYNSYTELRFSAIAVAGCNGRSSPQYPHDTNHDGQPSLTKAACRVRHWCRSA